jgi:hypothetical protein
MSGPSYALKTQELERALPGKWQSEAKIGGSPQQVCDPQFFGLDLLFVDSPLSDLEEFTKSLSLIESSCQLNCYSWRGSGRNNQLARKSATATAEENRRTMQRFVLFINTADEKLASELVSPKASF